jgi:hypothetical protein
MIIFKSLRCEYAIIILFKILNNMIIRTQLNMIMIKKKNDIHKLDLHSILITLHSYGNIHPSVITL